MNDPLGDIMTKSKLCIISISLSITLDGDTTKFDTSFTVKVVHI